MKIKIHNKSKSNYPLFNNLPKSILKNLGLGLGIGISVLGCNAPENKQEETTPPTLPNSSTISSDNQNNEAHPNNSNYETSNLKSGNQAPVYDTDGDGIHDNLDKCVDKPEDKDGFQDADGCPDLDNDKDGIADIKDKCPNKAGSAKSNGCPKRIIRNMGTRIAPRHPSKQHPPKPSPIKNTP
jgi:hypothetical protein